MYILVTDYKYIPDQFILERMATTANCLCLRVYVLKALFFITVIK